MQNIGHREYGNWMNCMFKGNERVFHISSIFCQVLGYLKDLRFKRFSWGALWGDEWYGFEISDFTVDP